MTSGPEHESATAPAVSEVDLAKPGSLGRRATWCEKFTWSSTFHSFVEMLDW